MLVHAKLQFNSPCLAGEKNKNGKWTFEKAANGRIFFYESKLFNSVLQAARILGRHQHLISRIRWNGEAIETSPIGSHQRYTHGRSYAQHEAVPRGGTIVLEATIPQEIGLEDFRELLSLAGKFFGLSPFGTKQGFGKYAVLLVEEKNPEPIKKPAVLCESTTGSAAQT